MKFCKLIGVVVALVTLVTAEETKKTFRVPTEIILQSGTVLRGVKAERWGTDHVVVKYVGGVAPIYFRHIKKPSAADIEEWRKDTEQKSTASAKPAAGNSRTTMKGQVFIVTVGAGTYKLGDVRILVYPGEPSTVQDMLQYASEVPAPVAETRSDADGNYSVEIPGGVHTLVAHAARLAGSYEVYYWFVRAEGEVLNLTGKNQSRISEPSTAMKSL